MNYCDHCDKPLTRVRLCRVCKIEICPSCHRGPCPTKRGPTQRGRDPLLRVSTTLKAADIKRAKRKAHKQRVSLSQWLRRTIKQALEEK